MRVNWKKGLAMGLGVCMAASVLTGCGKGKELDTAAAAAALDGEEISAGLVNFFLRYQQAEFESSYGAWLQSYYGTDIWNVDLSGTGTSYGETFKNDVINSLERLLLAEKHMGDYSVELTDEEKTAITQAAQEFMESNEEEVLEKMSATQENAERLLTLYTIQNKMETQMSADVDTEVSDEEAAQRTVSYVRFTAETESDTEEAEAETETEAGSESETEAAAEAETEAAETENETAPAEDATEASLTEAAADKTESADTEEATEGAENETVSEEETEADSEASTEAETETEELDPELAAAREEARAQAEAFLEEVKGGADFTEAAEAAAEENENVGTSTFTFGEDDTYPDEAIIEATAGLEDGTLVEQVVQVNNGFYVLRVDDAFDEAATEEKKESIVAERKSEAVNALYEEWMEEAEFTVDEDVLDQMVFDMSLTLETEAATEAAAEAESQSEAGSEAAAESQSEASTEAETEAGTESVTEETVTEAEEETETEAETEAVTESETETETETEA